MILFRILSIELRYEILFLIWDSWIYIFGYISVSITIDYYIVSEFVNLLSLAAFNCILITLILLGGDEWRKNHDKLISLQYKIQHII